MDQKQLNQYSIPDKRCCRNQRDSGHVTYPHNGLALDLANLPITKPFVLELLVLVRELLPEVQLCWSIGGAPA